MERAIDSFQAPSFMVPNWSRVAKSEAPAEGPNGISASASATPQRLGLPHRFPDLAGIYIALKRGAGMKTEPTADQLTIIGVFTTVATHSLFETYLISSSGEIPCASF